MKLCADAVKRFMEKKKDVYPFYSIPQTRRGYYPKWLLAASKNKQGTMWRRDGHCVIKSSCLSHDNVQQLIMSGDGIPLPVEFGEVVDALETWGAIHWPCWLQKALHLMYGYLRDDSMYGGLGPTKMKLFHDCILLGVQWKAMHHFYTNSPECNLILTNWNTYFWVRCRETYSFHELACDSMNCVRDMVESIHRDGPVTVAFQSMELARLTSVHLVPESPTSSTSTVHNTGESTEVRTQNNE